MRRVALLLGVFALFAGGLTTAFAASSHPQAKPCKPKTAKKCKKKKATTTKKTPTTPTQPGTPPAPGPAPKGGFAAGIYYRAPNGTVKLIGGSLPNIVVGDVKGFDVGQVLVWTSGSDIHVIQPNGTAKTVVTAGLFDLRHPSLSADGTKVAVQATETDPAQGAPDQWQSSYVVTLATGAWSRVAYTGAYPYDGNDVPVWLNANEIAYQATEQVNGQGCRVVQVADAASAAIKRTLRSQGSSGCETQVSQYWESPRTQMAASADGSKLFLVGTLQIVDANSGAVLGDLKDKVLAGLQAAGYAPDHRYPSRAGSTTAALGGSFAPDLKSVVFDGAIEKDFHYYQAVMQIGVDGTGFKILAGPFEADEPFVAGNAYSLLSTVWKS